MDSFTKQDQNTSKILALDLGDQWTGSAISDTLGFTAKPLQTIATADLEQFITKLLVKERLQEIIIGYPITLRGTESEQTKKIILKKNELKEKFPHVVWNLWDERLTSKQAGLLKKTRTKEEKLTSHSIAAAFILQSYLDYRFTQKTS